uniref:hypothetical protein n=1 Tax=Salmonella enterica TaxID=28901 RepID=UPI003D76831F
ADVLGFMSQDPVYRGFSHPGTEEEQTMTFSIHASAFDVKSWNKKITLTFNNESCNAVYMNHEAIT